MMPTGKLAQVKDCVRKEGNSPLYDLRINFKKPLKRGKKKTKLSKLIKYKYFKNNETTSLIYVTSDKSFVLISYIMSRND